MPLEPGQPRPVIRKRVGTTFPLSPKKLTKDGMINQDKVCYKSLFHLTMVANNSI